MMQFKYTVKDEMGLHARPAGMLVKKAKMYTDSEIRICKGEEEADLKRLFAVMSLGIKKGDEILITVEGGNESTAVPELREFFETNV